MEPQSEQLPAWQWRIGDGVQLFRGEPLDVVTLHRMEGVPPQVVVEFAGRDGQYHYEPAWLATVWRYHVAA